MKRFVKGLSIVLLAGLAAAATTPWRVSRSVVADAIPGGAARKAGLRVVVAGPVTLKLLPSPRLQAADLSLTVEDGAVMLDAPMLKAELDIPSLLGGVWRMRSATLVSPTLTVDVDRLAGRPAGADTVDDGAPVALRLRSGIIVTRSATGLADLIATDVDASAAWSGRGEHLLVSGSATWRGTTTRFAGALEHAARALKPEGSSASLALDSPLVSASADGILSGGAGEQFAGRVSLSTAALPSLLRRLDGFPVPIASRRAQVSGDLVVKPHDLSLSNAELRLDRARFEGTLAWRRDGARGLLDGTLATDLLDVDALVGDGLDSGRISGLYRAPLSASPFATDVDLRVSATTARLGRVTLEDAAMAALVRGDRLELTLDEARLSGGLVKARALATLKPGGIEAQADLSAKRVDLALLSEGSGGRARIGGFLTARAAVEGRGASLHDVVTGLSGDGRIGVENGRLDGLSLAQALRRLGRRVPLDADRRGTPTTFDSASWNVSIRGGVVRIPDGRLTAPGVALAFGAETGLPDGRVDVHAVGAETDKAGAPIPDGPSLPFDMRGTWAGPLTLVGRGAGLPAMVLPFADGFAAGR